MARNRTAAVDQHTSWKWPVSFLVVAFAFFALYQWIYPNLQSNVATQINDWLPLITINIALVYVIMALGLNIVVGYAGLLDLGYVAFWAIGGYVAGWLMSPFFFNVRVHFLPPVQPNKVIGAHGIHITFWGTIIIAALVCAFAGILIGAPTLRLRSDYLALVTLGFGEIIPEVFRNGSSLFGFNLTNGNLGITPVDPIGLGFLGKIKGIPVVISGGDQWMFLVFVFLAAVCVFISLRIRSGRLGRAWLAIREDELAASMMGVPLMRTKLASYAVGAAFGGIGGVAYATLVGGTLVDNFDFTKSITILLMVVLGGMGNVWGVILGALLLAWFNYTGLPQFGTWFNSTFNTNVNFPSWGFLIFGIVLVLMMLFRREGIIPERRTRQILREPARTELESIGADVEAAEAEQTDVEVLDTGEAPPEAVGVDGGGDR